MRTHKVAGVLSVGAGIVLLLGAATPSAAAKSKSISASNLKKLSTIVGNAKHLTYEATYKAVSAGQTTVVTIAQAPPKSDFSSGSGSVINTGKTTYYCSGTTGAQQCVSTGTGTNPVAAIEAAFSPSLALAAFSEAKQGLVERSLGVKATESSQTIAGQPSTCVTVSVKGHGGGKYCVTKSGLLAYSGSGSAGGGYFELTKFTKSPPASLFAVPAGASTVTLPGGVTIP